MATNRRPHRGPVSTCPTLLRVEAAARELAELFADADPILAALTLRKAATLLDEGRRGTAPSRGGGAEGSTPIDRRHRVAVPL